MPLNVGDIDATQGMSGEIFEALDGVLRPALADPAPDGMEMSDDDIEPIETKWRELSFAIAQGVIQHLERDPGEPEVTAEYAEVFSSTVQDPQFWQWLGGLAGVLQSWATLPQAQATALELRNRLNTFFQSNTTPGNLRGIIR